MQYNDEINKRVYYFEILCIYFYMCILSELHNISEKHGWNEHDSIQQDIELSLLSDNFRMKWVTL